MDTKFLEIRDRMTTIPALAIALSKADSPIAWRAGFGDEPSVLLIKLANMTIQCDPYEWPLAQGRTMRAAHLHIEAHWSDLLDGDVVDVEYLNGETPAPKAPECV